MLDALPTIPPRYAVAGLAFLLVMALIGLVNFLFYLGHLLH